MTAEDPRGTGLVKSDPNRLPREFGVFLLDFDRWERKRRTRKIALKYGSLLVVACAAVWLALSF